MAFTYEEVLENLHTIDAGKLDAAQTLELVLVLRKALVKIESPWQRMQKLVWEASGYAASLKAVHDLGIFKNWLARGNSTATFAEVVKMANSFCDEDVLRSLLSVLVFEGTLTFSMPDSYGQSEFSRTLGEPSMAACLEYWFDVQMPSLHRFPESLKLTSYRAPTDPTKTAWNLATGSPNPFFQWLQENPKTMGDFAMVMERYASSQLDWTSLYPAETLLEGSDAEAIVVDVGGSRGHDLLKFVDKFGIPAKSCHLLDRPEVIEVAKGVVLDRVTLHGLDFFKDEIPIKGARAYYLHSILHDWNDDLGRQLLVRLKSSMAPHSKILLHELVKLEDSSKDFASLSELTMMAILGAKERNERQWRDLIHSAGLTVTKIYSSPHASHCIIEAVAK